ncbi:GNAT family N-acetyltransferase [Alicyclobacillus sp. SO9]|uniref:GNAT family N-acetyltransferase n=1 Tax=Alicyclobacillus sp. SO9 TaxID=2665646 RepID=UPI0018E76DEE|nr:N-acetyltransferase [Alicyclobacillus sp. SO9]QQE79132.1 GNAT family N-acetyltransferase [Alicyclobacillus sp. SO9]
MEIRQAVLEDADQLAAIFNAYRSHFGGKSDVSASMEFLKDRMMSADSVIFYAYDERSDEQSAIRAVTGFAQLYPSFSSVTLENLWILNDLYVTETTRGQGVGRLLLHHVLHFAHERSSKGVILETTPENTRAQAFYKRNRFVRDKAHHFTHYFSEQK